MGIYDGRVVRMRNDGTAAEPRWAQLGGISAIQANGRRHPAPTLADIDNDGDLDLFVGWGNGTVDYLRNIGTASNPRWVLTATGYGGIDVGDDAMPAFGDMDGDGDYDLFIGEEAGTITFYRNTGTPGNPTWAAPQTG